MKNINNNIKETYSESLRDKNYIQLYPNPRYDLTIKNCLNLSVLQKGLFCKDLSLKNRLKQRKSLFVKPITIDVPRNSFKLIVMDVIFKSTHFKNELIIIKNEQEVLNRKAEKVNFIFYNEEKKEIVIII